MKWNAGPLMFVVLLMISIICQAQTEPMLEPATPAILNAFESHDVVMLGEIHGNKQEYDWLRSLIDTPEFADRVDAIVMEFGNSLYQDSVDRYLRGDEIPLEEVQGAWLDTVASVGPPSPVYASLYQAVRETTSHARANINLAFSAGIPMSIGSRSKKEKTSCRTWAVANSGMRRS